MTRPAAPIRLYHFPLSGHAHRVELFLSLLGLPFERVTVNLLAGEQKTPAFLAKNAFGQVPVIEDGGVTLADSNAILVYLAGRYDADHRWLPVDPERAAHVQRWLSAAAGPMAYGAAAARLVHVFGMPLDHARAKAAAEQVFGVMEGSLAGRNWLVGDAITLADVAMYTYTAHAPEGAIPLDAYPNVRAWLARVESLPGFVPMQRSAVPAA
ncbi:glutathione S-transferase [Pendulispora rubella]|uniref:Glutathione S-transferase n=1 Tax=Pendulispora rubella TaxID=2741070 RepID=A0ABZ2KVB8_9BACT